jgi:putative ATP-dependent endonuclease of OLD family
LKLVSFTVTKYRSITKAHKSPVDRQAVLVGPNNEGKSNLLRALVTAMKVLVRARFASPDDPTRPLRLSHRDLYDWNRDYPLTLQRSTPTGRSEITLEFELTAEEVADFRREVKSELNGTLPLRVSLGTRGDARLEVVKKGPGGKALTAKSRKIAKFVSERVNFEQIPAVRTASAAERIVSEMVERELQSLEGDSNYVNALEAIAALQQPLLDRLSSSIRATLVQFLPDVREVQVRIPAEERYRALRRSCQIVVNDGTATLLQHKGDGVQSLAALGIMRHASESSAIGRNLVIAIEEPESHLHPGAIHELKGVLRELSEKHQLVITTHNPLFVDRAALKSNIVVKDNRARPAKSIEELRDALGVKASDNLRHADIVLLVEGEDDRIALQALLRHHSTRCRQILDNGHLAIDTLGGATNLAYKVGLIRAALCSVHCFLDHDAAAKEAFDRARLDGLITDADVNWATSDGMRESEIEDLYLPDLYAAALQNAFRVSIEAPEFRTAAKWSQRMARTFQRQGKPWDDRIEKNIKQRVAELVASDPARALLPARRASFDALVATLESRISELGRTS